MSRLRSAIAAMSAEIPDGQSEEVSEATCRLVRLDPEATADEYHGLAHHAIDHLTNSAGPLGLCDFVSYALQIGTLIGYHLAESDATERTVGD